MGYSAWIDDQFTRPASHLMNYGAGQPEPFPAAGVPGYGGLQRLVAAGGYRPDQLRQRVAFALSEIMVVSDVGALNNNALLLASYYDTLSDNALATTATCSRR